MLVVPPEPRAALVRITAGCVGSKIKCHVDVHEPDHIVRTTSPSEVWEARFEHETAFVPIDASIDGMDVGESPGALRWQPCGVRDDGLVSNDGETVFECVMIPDSMDARLFLELASYGADLSEARHALDLACEGGEDSPLLAASAYLIGFAALAYCRTFFASNVPKPLTSHIEIPAGLEAIHRLVGAFRNTTIAHSQSELSTTFPVGILDAGTLRVRHVTAATYSQTLPPPLVSRFLELLGAVDDLLFEATEPVRQRLIEELAKSDRAVMVARGARPNVINATDADFDPRTKRLPYPISHKLHWSSTPLSSQ